MRNIAELRIDEMAIEFRSLSDSLRQLDRSGNGELGDPMRARMAELTRGIANATAVNVGELALKAGVALEWLEQCDMPGMMCASLCRDVILMFPVEP